MNNISSLENKKCLSCRSCEQICPKNAIIMKENKDGFLNPYIQPEKCIDCGMCIKHCPVLSCVEKEQFQQEAYAAWLTDSNKLLQSTSGGVFTGLAEYFLENDGIVFGAAYDDNLCVHQIGVNNIHDLQKIKGSKYVASDTDHSFQEVRSLLLDGNKVLYSGTPCQIAGLKAFLSKEYENLLTVDIFCHGTPSSKLFRKYLDWKESKIKQKITYYGFRDKNICGWTCCGNTLIKTNEKDYVFKGYSDPYYASFFRGESFGIKCYSCPFSNKNRYGDISIGDFWGVDKVFPKIDSNQGVSAVIINSEKGKKLLQKINDKMNLYETSIESIVLQNDALNEKRRIGMRKEIIYKDIDNSDLNKYFTHFTETHIISKLKFFIRRIIAFALPKSLKKLILCLYMKIRGIA